LLSKIILIGISLLLLLPAACISSVRLNNQIPPSNAVPGSTSVGPTIISPSSSTPNAYWAEAGGSIQTNDYSRLQKELPFTIVFPKYIPDELKKYPPSFIYIKSFASGDPFEPIEPNLVQVTFSFQTYSGDFKRIHFSEVNSAFPWEVGTNSGYIEWNSNGIQILEKVSKDEGLSEYEKKEVIDFNYIWYWNSIRFEARITGYDQQESRRFIESVFEPSN
jgi:hypothetical protein